MLINYVEKVRESIKELRKDINKQVNDALKREVEQGSITQDDVRSKEIVDKLMDTCEAVLMLDACFMAETQHEFIKLHNENEKIMELLNKRIEA